jgi:hypothetical protein
MGIPYTPDHGYVPGMLVEWTTACGHEDRGSVLFAENNLGHLWLRVHAFPEFKSPNLRGVKKFWVDAARVTGRSNAIRQRTRPR